MPGTAVLREVNQRRGRLCYGRRMTAGTAVLREVNHGGDRRATMQERYAKWPCVAAEQVQSRSDLQPEWPHQAGWENFSLSMRE